MLRIVFLGLVVLELVLLTTLALSPVNAAISNPEQVASDKLESYIWSFADLGSNQVVCKKIVMHPESQLRRSSSNNPVIKMDSTSTIVNDSYCANSPKFYLGGS